MIEINPGDASGDIDKAKAVAEADFTDTSQDVSISDVRRWLKSWGKPRELPPPPWR